MHLSLDFLRKGCIISISDLRRMLFIRLKNTKTEVL